MWCSILIIFSNPKAFLISPVKKIVSLLTEFERLNPVSAVIPSSRENNFAVIKVYKTLRGLSFSMNTEILNSISIPNLLRK